MAGEDRSTALLGRVEEILVAHFPDSPAFEEPAEPLSLFRPVPGRPATASGTCVRHFRVRYTGRIPWKG
ncbi:hypothetical protein AN217_00690 [Streptomyces qinglanensis]|uniref:Uncharacterized protein n=1 Tax=Streptomyces qinglanensis TaxID=943816 RepID=A0A1E7KDB0_9ACTN|nr:hypothetical protein AN217_00690 [Streptomyces qinglanensis]OEV08918.1 hypothetical protein AN220_32250 [Streptomyces nanshensis]